MITKLLISEADELNVLYKKHRGTTITNLKAELEEVGATDIVELKAYSKMQGWSSANIKTLFLSGAKSVVFRASGECESDFDNLDVWLSLAGLKARLYEFPTDATKDDMQTKFEVLLDDYNTRNEPIANYWEYRSKLDFSYTRMPIKHWDRQLELITKLRAWSGPLDSSHAYTFETNLCKYFKETYANNLPADVRSYADLNRFMYQTAEFFELECVRKH